MIVSGHLWDMQLVNHEGESDKMLPEIRRWWDLFVFNLNIHHFFGLPSNALLQMLIKYGKTLNNSGGHTCSRSKQIVSL